MIRQVPLRSACGPGPKFFEMQVRVFMSRPPWRKTHRERKKGSKVSKYQSYLNIKDIQNVLVNVMNASSPIRTFFIHISSKLCGWNSEPNWRDAHGSSSFSTKTTPHVFCQPVVIVHTPILGRSGPRHQRMTTKYHITAYIIWIHMNHMDMELTSRNPSSFMNVEGGSLQIRVWMWFLIYSRYFPIQSIQYLASSRIPWAWSKFRYVGRKLWDTTMKYKPTTYRFHWNTILSPSLVVHDHKNASGVSTVAGPMFVSPKTALRPKNMSLQDPCDWQI